MIRNKLIKIILKYHCLGDPQINQIYALFTIAVLKNLNKANIYSPSLWKFQSSSQFLVSSPHSDINNGTVLQAGVTGTQHPVVQTDTLQTVQQSSNISGKK